MVAVDLRTWLDKVEELGQLDWLLIENHACEGYGRAGLRGKGLTVLKTPPLTPIQKMNQRIKGREAAYPSAVFVLGDLMEETLRVQGREPFDKAAILLFYPS